ncbi:hypothetical protein AA23498_3049 [Acetobacter nitrogenifigens DSM 23921 = NBRC 105050]|uniref:Uncharacterized protein n=1 Tax=Acetobacter nitrogenifigens DSM 23921 = NBRC 105050 TaxID=1120919 RepID=A0A511X9W8_9PROT|nr:hypothetical protein [Acetobacter nitrogenifigens]GBQ97968.1 hypothetical protein AA23498_3049 [Acetobacter nitrogenifigens DSM 23921 = NBRC 105050]GEN59743.1 hypothetical protein ANI02nite_16270 [Acetobacter nitrogenifigens DSM 23921 = NBRC 105050]
MAGGTLNRKGVFSMSHSALFFAIRLGVTALSAALFSTLWLAAPGRQRVASGLLAFWIPALLLAFMTPGWLHEAHVPAEAVFGSLAQGACISLAAALPALAALAHAPGDLARTARGLGADWRARALLLWLPLLRGRLLFGLGVILVLSAALAAMDLRRVVS